MTDADPQVAGHARTIAILTAAARLAGFARTLVFAATVGATALGSVYQSTNTVPNVVYEIAAGGILAAATVPLLAGRAAAGDRESASRIASGLVGWVLLVLAPLSLLVAILARPVASALLDEETLGERAVDQGATMLLVFAPQVLLYGLGIVLSGVLQAHRRFAAAAAAPLISSLVVIATYAAYGLLATDPADPWAGMLHLLAWGTTAGVAAMLLTLLPSLRGLGVRIRPTLRFPPGVAARAGRLAGAGLLALLAQQVCVLAVVWLSNHRGGAGVLITYQYAQALYLLPYAVLAVPLATAAFPVIAAAGELGDGATGDGAAVVSRTLRGIAVVAVAGATALVTAAPQLGQVFAALDRSSTSGAAASATAVGDLPVALTALTPGLVGFALSALLVRALYARGPARRAALAVAAGWLLAALVPLVVTQGRGGPRATLVAIGSGSSLGMTASAIALAVLLRRAWGAASLAGLGAVLVRSGMAALVAVLLLRLGLGHVWPGPGAVGVALVRGGLAGLVAALVVLAAAPGGARAALRDGVRA